LKRQLGQLQQARETKHAEIARLREQLTVLEGRSSTVRCSLIETVKIADEMEAKARQKAEKILAEAELAAALQKAELLAIEKEMAALDKELCSYEIIEEENPAAEKDLLEKLAEGLLDEQKTSALLEENGIDLEEIAKAFSDGRNAQETETPLAFKPSSSADSESIYNMKVVTFVNACHYVTFGKNPGPVHAHSWQVEIEVSVPQEIGETIEFNKVFKAVSSALSIYENTVLNHVYPFNKIQPTTENISMYFFNLIQDALSEMGLGLARLNLWETPTRGIEVNNRNSSMDDIILSDEEFPETYEEAAVATDINLEIEEEEEPPEISSRIFLEAAEISLRPSYSIRQYFFAALLITVAAIILYNNILWAPMEQHYPWGEDSWGHLFKAESLYHEIIQGNYYPQFTEYWYNGSQPFRYWAPLPYYALAFLMAVSGNIFTAGNLYIFLCALLGALSWLLLSRRMGLWPAVMCGLIWLIWQDNVRVAFSEGNLPRVLATALLPLLFFLFLHTIQNRKSYKGIIATALVIHLVILCHAMMGAIYCICLALFGFFLWFFRGCQLPNLLQALMALFLGILSSCWWLLPSLSGGITGIDAQAVKEAMIDMDYLLGWMPAEASLNPLRRFTYTGTFYWGIVLVTGLILNIITWKSKPAWAKSASLLGLILIVITFPFIRGFYIVLPLSHLLWPLRFSSVAALMILAASFTFNLSGHRQKWLQSPYMITAIIMVLFVMQIADCLVSFRFLARTGSRPYEIIQTAEFIRKDPGWRVATVDLSQLGSAPSYTFSQAAALEQVFGWAWQGATTSRNIMLLNTGLENQYYPFLFRSCVDLGATELVVKEDVVTDLKSFQHAALMAGYTQVERISNMSVWHSIDNPYLVRKEPQCLAIGKYVGTVAVQFPAVEMGISPDIDQYDVDKLKEYPMLILSGASWQSKSKAEEIIKEYLDFGGRVFVELAGMPENILAKQPEFLGVYGEPISIRDEIEVWGKDRRLVLSPVSLGEKDWHAYVPMELDGVELEFSYYGNQAPILGYKMVNNHKVWFLGNNITYHTFLTADPESLDLLQELFELDSSYETDTLIPLQHYEASENGYRMTYSLERAETAVVPVAALDGMRVELDNQEIQADNYENLLKLELPAGKHDINIHLEKTPVYKWGMGLSLLSAILLAVGFVYFRKKGDQL
jgi:6-pyruvoyl tetrahydropterin synthase-like protein